MEGLLEKSNKLYLVTRLSRLLVVCVAIHVDRFGLGFTLEALQQALHFCNL